MNGFGRTPEERERARIEREQRRQGTRPSPTPPSVPPPPAPAPGQEARPSAASPDKYDPLSAPLPRRRGPGSRRPPREPRAPREPRVRRAPRGGATAVGRRRLVVISALLVALVVVLWLLNSIFQPFAGDGKGTGAIPLTVPAGSSVGQIASLLADKGAVDNSQFFGWRARWSGKADDFKAGQYSFGRGMSYSAAIEMLTKGPNLQKTTITIVEGRSRYEIAEQLKATPISGDYMAASRSSKLLSPLRYGASRATDLEGFLFPATYELQPGATVNVLVAQQLKAFRDNFAQVNLRYARSKNLTAYDVLTIASLVEREVQVPKERRLVAAVIYNRLKQGIPLGIDASTRFAVRNWSRPLTNVELRTGSPYNTRNHRGLPPGPIGNPGLASIEAASRPAKVGYLYYVADPCKPGYHSFSSSDSEFQADVQRYQQARTKAGGNQPSGC
jgi:uncharacterized YceG family protein